MRYRKLTAAARMVIVAVSVLAVPEFSTASGNTRPVVAVFDVKADGLKLPPATIKRLTDYMGTRLTIGGYYQVMPESALKEAMVELKLGSQADCFDDKCRVELGRAASAQKNVNTLIWKIGNECSVTATVFDLRAEASEKAAEVSGIDCSEASLKKGIAQVAAQLSGKAVESSGTVQAGGDESLPPPPVSSSGGRTVDYDDAPPPVKAEVGYLSVEGGPRGARVDIFGPKGFGDKGTVATVMPVRPFQVPAGNYTVKVSQDEYITEERAVRVFSDSTEIVRIDLVSAFGTLEISGNPDGARSRLECGKGFSKDFGLPSRAWRVKVPTGICRITAERDGYERYDESIDVKGGETTAVSVDLSKNRLGIQWIRIPGGSFDMGANDGKDDEKPVHRVSVKTFEMSRSEVTQRQYQACVDAGVCTRPHWDDNTCYVWDGSWVQKNPPANLKGDDLPVVCVDWEQASTFAKWAGGRLPTEAEWEYAAKSGGKPRKFPWGSADATCSKTVMYENGYGCGRDSTWPVCSKPAGDTDHGLCDMAGNVWEWTEDWYHENYVGAPTDGSAWMFPVGTNHVIRGGLWIVAPEHLRTAARDRLNPSCYGLGIRLARTPR